MGVCRLSIDYNRSFKYLAAYDIKNYIEKFNTEPSVLMIDAPQDEETKFLHEIYGTLEELNNGRVEGFFGGCRIKFRIKRGIKIIVMSNSPPVLKSLSNGFVTNKFFELGVNLSRLTVFLLFGVFINVAFSDGFFLLQRPSLL